MGKSFLAVFYMMIVTAVLSAVAWNCDVRSGADRGWVHTADASYYYDDNGDEYTGMHVMPDDGTTRYFDPNTHIMVTGEVEIDGQKYLFDESGVMAVGFQKVNGNIRYFSLETGAMQTGWYSSDEATYYFDKATGDLLTGWSEIDGNKYYFAADDGQLAKGLFSLEDGQHFANPETGVIGTGLQKIDNKQYYFDETTGLMKNGWINIGEDKYYFDETTGEGLSGIREVDGKIYGFIGGLSLRNERAMTSNHIYYFDAEGTIVREIDGTKPMVAITYDDGPSKYTDEILDTYLQYGQRCTFFLVGDRISWNEEQAIREAENGFQQGNHTYGHNRLTDLDKDGQRETLQKTDDELIRISGKPSSCLRPPEGRWDDNLKETSQNPIVLWSVDSRDWASKDCDKICDAIIGKVKDGDIVLMHDLYQATADATKKIVPALIDAGFQLVTVEEMGLLKCGGLKNGEVYYSI